MSKRAPKTPRKSPRHDRREAVGTGPGVGPSTTAGAAAEVIIRQRGGECMDMDGSLLLMQLRFLQALLLLIKRCQ